MADCFVHLVPMPSKVHECVVPNEDGSYSIFIADNLCIEQQRECYLHALSHVESNDFEKECADIIEYEAHMRSTHADRKE